MHLSSILVTILLILASGVAQEPARLPHVATEGKSEVCPSAEMTERVANSTKEAISSILRALDPVPSTDAIVGPTTVDPETSTVDPETSTVDPETSTVDPVTLSVLVPTVDTCPCGGPGVWQRIAHLDMRDPNQQCPTDWKLITAPVRACGRGSNDSSNCDSAIFQSNGSFSRVCGRINAIQFGSTHAFGPSFEGDKLGLEGSYVDGVSLTHGATGSREHIWTFASALYETDFNYVDNLPRVCPCTNTNFEFSEEIPSFVGSNYSCDTGNPGPGSVNNVFYQDDPLWDGEGCGPDSTCCQTSWFCATLPQATTNDIELRICGGDSPSNGDVNVQLVDVYTMM